jgi:hypothetical protein
MKIYVLELNSGKYYVGKTDNLEKRLIQHQTKGLPKPIPCWVSTWGFKNVIEVVDGDTFDEDKFVLKYMNIYGIDNVRGGSYSNLVLTFHQKLNLYKQLRNARNECLICGSQDHFMSQCEAKICYRCGRTGHTVEKCFAKTHFYDGKLDGCYRCGRPDHWAIRCNRTKDVFGKILDPRKCVLM